MSSDQIHESWESYQNGQASIWQVYASTHVFQADRSCSVIHLATCTKNNCYSRQIHRAWEKQLAGKNIRNVV